MAVDELHLGVLDGDQLAAALGEDVLTLMAAAGAEPVAVLVFRGQGEEILVAATATATATAAGADAATREGNGRQGDRGDQGPEKRGKQMFVRAGHSVSEH